MALPLHGKLWYPSAKAQQADVCDESTLHAVKRTRKRLCPYGPVQLCLDAVNTVTERGLARWLSGLEPWPTTLQQTGGLAQRTTYS